MGGGMGVVWKEASPIAAPGIRGCILGPATGDALKK